MTTERETTMNDRKEPCGECFLPASEVCDICGATGPSPKAALTPSPVDASQSPDPAIYTGLSGIWSSSIHANHAAPDPAAMPQAKRCAACGSTVTDLDDHLVHDEECGGEPDEPVAAPNLKRIGTGLYETQPAPDPAAIREAALREAAAVAQRYAETDYCAMGYPEDGGIAASGTAHTIQHDILALIPKGAAE